MQKTKLDTVDILGMVCELFSREHVDVELTANYGGKTGIFVGEVFCEVQPFVSWHGRVSCNNPLVNALRKSKPICRGHSPENAARIIHSFIKENLSSFKEMYSKTKADLDRSRLCNNIISQIKENKLIHGWPYNCGTIGIRIEHSGIEIAPDKVDPEFLRELSILNDEIQRKIDTFIFKQKARGIIKE